MKRVLLLLLMLMPIVVFSQQLIAPGVTLFYNDSSYHIQYRATDYAITADTVENNPFCSVDVVGHICDRSEFLGLPEIPFLTYELQFPDGAVVTNVDIANLKIEKINISKPVTPSQAAIESDQNFYMDSLYYFKSDGSSLRQPYATMSNLYSYIGTTGGTVGINPVYYRPDLSELEVVISLDVTITFTSKQSLSDMISEYLSGKHFEDAMIYYDTYSGTNWEIDPKAKGNFLIIYDDQYENLVDYFADYKTNIGYEVKSFSTSYVGNTAQRVRSFIKDLYDNQVFRPRFVLLVGNITQIPQSSYHIVDNKKNPPTDLFYACVEKTRLDDEDLIPDLFLGRWMVSDNTELQNLVYKTINTEEDLALLPRNNRRATLLAGKGNGEREFNRNIDKINNSFLSPLYSTCILREKNNQYYTHFEAEYKNEKPFLILYRGHGNYTNWANGFIIQSQFPNVSNNKDYKPFFFSFACNTNSFFYDYKRNLGTFLLNTQNGGVSHFGSTIESYRSSNNRSAKKVMEQVEKYNYIHLAQMTVNGMCKYLNGSPYYWMRKCQVKKYVLLGDPSIYLYGIDNRTGNPAYYAPSQDFDSSDSENFNENINIDSRHINIVSTDISKFIFLKVFTLSGQCIYTTSDTNISLNHIPNGIYVLKFEFSNNSTTKKIVL